MGLRYDWEIEAEKTQVQRASESAASKRGRRRARLRFLIFLLFILGIFGGLTAFVVLRLQAVEREIEQSLRGTVDAEVTALRLGDYASFSAIQRSASADWLQFQQQIFNQYQDLKMQEGVQLSGTISDLAVDRNRARVHVQEIVNGIPYTRIWFYWRYEDGWRHVPPDYTFWGDLEIRKIQNVTVRYQMVDAAFAQMVGEKLASWLQAGCQAVTCANLPDVTVEIVPDETLQPSWATGTEWRLEVPSPFVRRARSDMPFDVELQLAVADTLADRLVSEASNSLQPEYSSDAYYLRQAIVSWLVGSMVQVDTQSYLMNTLVTNFGAQAVGQLLKAMQPNSTISILAQVSGKTLEQTGLDWRDYLTWRLTVEHELLQRRDEVGFLALYDTRDAATRDLAYQRFNANTSLQEAVVASVQSEVSADGVVSLRTVVMYGGQQETVVFRLADGVWKRVN